jgi:hypothetical protein
MQSWYIVRGIEAYSHDEWWMWTAEGYAGVSESVRLSVIPAEEFVRGVG